MFSLACVVIYFVGPFSLNLEVLLYSPYLFHNALAKLSFLAVVENLLERPVNEGRWRQSSEYNVDTRV